jgi:hypothetical protein
MMWSTPDLADITHVLRGLLEQAIQSSTLGQGKIKVHCDSPETARNTHDDCHLTLYLLHVGRDPVWRNTPLQGVKPQLNRAQPLSLNLSYLLTAWSDKDFATEQLAMSIALQTLHSNAIVTNKIIVAHNLEQWLPQGEFVVSIEADTIEEMSRLWQAFTVPMRLSALIRASVIFIAPVDPLDPPSIPPYTANLSVAPDPIAPLDPLSPLPPLLARGFSQQTAPLAPNAGPSTTTANQGPLIATAGGFLQVSGNSLDTTGASDVFLSVPGTAVEWKVTPWRQPDVMSGELTLGLPIAYADPAVQPPPAATPLPGFYNLTVGTGTARSNAIAIAVAPSLDTKDNPPPVLPKPASGPYVINGAGFVASSATKLSLGATPLGFVAGAPSAGKFSVDPTGAQILFVPPAATPPGYYPLLLSVNAVAATTGWVVLL